MQIEKTGRGKFPGKSERTGGSHVSGRFRVIRAKESRPGHKLAGRL